MKTGLKRWVSGLLGGAVALGMLCAGGALGEGDGYIYGTMRIPYADFYAAEGVSGEVDAVSSATNSKWKSDTLAAGTYSQPHADDEGGDILGVVFPVAIAPADLEALGDDNGGFAALDEVPAAYKIASVSEGRLSFSAVQGERAALEAELSLSTDAPWGDYVLDVSAIHNADGSSDIGTIYGALLTTDDGAVYALRHLQNIWRDELAWSTGFTTVEPHGSTLSSAPYADMMGKTIREVTYITDSGYHSIAAEIYVPVKFDGGVEVADAPAASGEAAVTLTNLPEDFAPAFSVDLPGADVSAERVSFADALPGAYTLNVDDAGGKYAPISADFVLTTDAMPVAFDPAAGALVPAEGADEALAAAFIANISSVTVNDASYAASGHGAVVIINADGALDTEAALVQGRGENATMTPIFPDAGEYALSVAATGFEQSLSFTVTIER